MEIKIEQFDYDRHYLRFAPLFVRYYREVNKENVEHEILVTLNGRQQMVKRYDAEIHGMAMNGVFCKLAIVDDEIVGFIWYRSCLHHFLLPVDAFYVRKEFRSTKVGLALLNSFINEKNRGWFEIVAFIHDNNRPEEMLKAFHGWEIVRFCNDRDLIMIRGQWDVSLYQKKESVIHSGEVNDVPIPAKPKKTRPNAGLDGGPAGGNGSAAATNSVSFADFPGGRRAGEPRPMGRT